MPVTTSAYAGQDVSVNDARVRFGPDGVCEGIVGYADGRVADPPDPLRPEDVAVFAAIPMYVVTPDPPATVAAPPARLDVDVEPDPEELYTVLPCAPMWIADGDDLVPATASDVPSVTTTTNALPLLTIQQLDTMTRVELVEYAAERGEEIEARSKRRALEIIREAGLVGE